MDGSKFVKFTVHDSNGCSVMVDLARVISVRENKDSKTPRTLIQLDKEYFFVEGEFQQVCDSLGI